MSDDTLTTSSPRRPPAATGPAVVVAIVLIGVAVVAVHDLLVDRGAADGSPWVASVVTNLDGLEPAWWTTAIAVVVILVGLLLLRTALRPARRTHQATPMDDGDVWISKRAVQRLSEQAAERTTGVETADAQVRRRKVVVRTTLATAAGSDTSEISDRVEHNVRSALDGFSDLPVTVRTKEAPDVT